MTCPFCSPAVDASVIAGDEHCVALATPDGPPGGVIVVPRAHRTTPFELTDAELASTRDLLDALHQRVSVAADGWNVGRVAGQEVDHVHCHLVPRFADETYAGRGIRWWIKQPANRRGGGS